MLISEIATECFLTPLPGNKIFEIFSHMCNICNTNPEKAVTALGRVSGSEVGSDRIRIFVFAGFQLPIIH